ncbi:MAG: hypothetical protein U0822_03505 [Anaerolineae bacterium]
MIAQILGLIIGVPLFVIGVVFVLLFIVAAYAPIESLSWWAGWDEDSEEPQAVYPYNVAPQYLRTDIPEADHYLVYLSGIGAISGDNVPQEEYPFIKLLENRLPGTRVITDVFPYSVNNKGLTSQRALSWLWDRIAALRLKNPNAALALLVNLRNVLQLFVSADRRYGPVYNLGGANEVWRGLLRAGYRPGSKKPVTILGWSGGGQIAIGSAIYLPGIDAPLRVISLGGMLSDDVGLLRIHHLWHLYGTKDVVQAMGQRMFSGRWPIRKDSPWNRQMRAGKISMIPLGPYVHNGKGNYFDMENKLPDGIVYGEHTVDVIVECLASAGLVQPGVGEEAAYAAASVLAADIRADGVLGHAADSSFNGKVDDDEVGPTQPSSQE